MYLVKSSIKQNLKRIWFDFNLTDLSVFLMILSYIFFVSSKKRKHEINISLSPTKIIT